jgi:ribonuclease Y
LDFVVIVVVSVVIGGGLAFALDWSRRQRQGTEAEQTHAIAARALEEARKESEVIRREAQVQAKDVLLNARQTAEQEIRERRREVQQIEKRILAKEEAIEKRLQSLETRDNEYTRRDATLRDRESQLADKEREAVENVRLSREKLEEVAEMSREEAKRSLLDSMLAEARHEAAKKIRQIEDEAKQEAERKSKKIVSIAIERLAGDFVAERTVTVVPIPSDDMKGRIIGREGRNIRAIEAATGVDLIVDDTPESVVVSCHNPIRREIARLALQRLISDGRIHPGRIEEVVRKAEQELDNNIREIGQKAIFEIGIHGVHPEIVKLVGMLRYRYSYAQNVLQHSLEAAFICGAMAAELGLNEKQARRAALLHDIGKALTHEVEGSHAIIGAEIARKYGESAKIVNAIAAHHEEVRAETILAPLVDAADALSGARPGARREVLESYVKRLDDLERISTSFQGVEKAFAVQAGREVRIIVEPGRVDDDQAAVLARDVARKIEAEMTYPGQIKVTVIRELRASEVAR